MHEVPLALPLQSNTFLPCGFALLLQKIQFEWTLPHAGLLLRAMQGCTDCTQHQCVFFSSLNLH